MLFIGHTRFSLFNPDSPAWKASNGSTFADREQYKKHLYDPERLDLRTEIFVNQSLPQIALAAEGYDVRHLVMYSESLPEKYQAALEQAAEQYPFLVLDCRSSSSPNVEPRHVAKRLIGETFGEPDQAFGIYRLDDDDLLPVSYFDQMSAHVRHANVGMQVSLGEGMTGLLVDGGFWNARSCYWPMFSAGLMNICAFDDEGVLVGPASARHNVSDRTNPVILDSRGVGFFWTRHAGQDTSLPYGAGADPRVIDRVLANMSRFPPLHDLDVLDSEFPVLRGKVSLTPKPGLERHVLVDDPTAIDDQGVPLELPSISGQFELSLDIDCSTDAIASNALFSLNLEHSNGSPLDRGRYKDALASQSVWLSSDRRIGFYRYIQTTPGASTLSYQVNLPQGVVCNGVLVRRWKRSATTISLTGATVVASGGKAAA